MGFPEHSKVFVPTQSLLDLASIIPGGVGHLHNASYDAEKNPLFLKFLNHRITLSGLNPFGSVSAGMIQVRGSESVAWL